MLFASLTTKVGSNPYSDLLAQNETFQNMCVCGGGGGGGGGCKRLTRTNEARNGKEADTTDKRREENQEDAELAQNGVDGGHDKGEITLPDRAKNPRRKGRNCSHVCQQVRGKDAQGGVFKMAAPTLAAVTAALLLAGSTEPSFAGT